MAGGGWRWSGIGVLLCALALRTWAEQSPGSPDETHTIQAPEATAETPPAQPEGLEEIIVTAPEPRFVAPTRRDRIGRIWAPVRIDGKGPYRMVLDSGANRTGIIQSVATQLALPATGRVVLLRGVTGTARVPVVRARTLEVGDLLLGPADLPIITDALGGADGILGTDRLLDRRIFIDFRHDLITIARSHSERAPPDFLTIPFRLIRDNLLAVDATMANIPVVAIIDTGGQVTVANRALQRSLSRWRRKLVTRPDTIVGVTLDTQETDVAATPPIQIDSTKRGESLLIRSQSMSFGDMRIFEHWALTTKPALMIGMDALGTLDTLIIDYKRQELQVKMRRDL